MNERLQTAVEYWMSAKRQFEYETKGLTLVLHELSDEELTGIKAVSPWFLDFAPFMFNVYQKRFHPKLRTTIAYLTALQALQSGAWQRKANEWERETSELKQLIKELPGLTASERKERIWSHFKFEQWEAQPIL